MTVDGAPHPYICVRLTYLMPIFGKSSRWPPEAHNSYRKVVYQMQSASYFFHLHLSWIYRVHDGDLYTLFLDRQLLLCMYVYIVYALQFFRFTKRHTFYIYICIYQVSRCLRDYRGRSKYSRVRLAANRGNKIFKTGPPLRFYFYRRSCFIMSSVCC